MAKERPRRSAEFTFQVVLKELREQKTLSQLAAESSVHPTQLKEWKKTALAGLPELFSRDGKASDRVLKEHEQQVSHCSNPSLDVELRVRVRYSRPGDAAV